MTMITMVLMAYTFLVVLVVDDTVVLPPDSFVVVTVSDFNVRPKVCKVPHQVRPAQKAVFMLVGSMMKYAKAVPINGINKASMRK